MAFSNRLKLYRTNMGLKQEELAKNIGVSQKTISSWEVGRSEPTMKEVAKLCKIFDCTVEDLTDTRVRKVGEISIDDIMYKIDKLDKDDLQKIDYHIKARMELLVERERIQNEKDILMERMAILHRQLIDLEKKKEKIDNGNS